MQVQVQYTQYFQSLCDALQAFGSDMHNLEVLVCRRRRNNGNKKMADPENINMSSKAKQCIPLLNILGFAADLVSLLPATQDVAGLLPCPLVKAFTLLGGNAILGACNFGIHNQVRVSSAIKNTSCELAHNCCLSFCHHIGNFEDLLPFVLFRFLLKALCI